MEIATQFTPAKPRRAIDDIIDQVRELLQSGELSPGDKLPSERSFAEQLNVSRNTVREALRMLEVTGLITLKRGTTGGAFVVESNSDAVSRFLMDGMALTNYSLKDVIDGRIAVESFVAERVAEISTEAEIVELEQIVARATKYDAPEDWPQRLAAHFEFHRRLVELAQNPLLPILSNPLLDLANRISTRLGAFADDIIFDSRARLLKAFRDRDPSAAANEMRRYLNLLYSRWIEVPPED